MNYVCTFTNKNCIKNIFQVWLPSLKKNFSGKIVVITFNVSEEDILKLQEQNVIVIERKTKRKGRGVIAERLQIQEEFINTLEENDKIMLVDGADVVFQSEIDSVFDNMENKIYYSTTGTLTNQVTINWVQKAFKYDEKEQLNIIEQLKTKEIVACGMLLGTKSSFLSYFQKHNDIVNRFRIFHFTGANQIVLTYLILKNPEFFVKTFFHNCRLFDKDIIKENGIYKISKIIPIVHFSEANAKIEYINNYIKPYTDIPKIDTPKQKSLNILWLYGSVPKFDVINHWYHIGFARIINKLPNVNLMVYGLDMEKLYPDLAKIPFNINITGKDLKKEFDFDIIIMDNKNRFAYSRTLAERKAKKARIFWLKPEFFNGLDNIPKVFLEGDYHLHFKMGLEEEKTWYQDMKVDLLLVRHLSALDYHQDKNMPIQWFPCSVNTDIFKPSPIIQRKNKICLISGYGLNYYSYRNTAGKILQENDLIDIYNKRFIGQDYINNLQSYICHLSGSSIRAITPAKMFEIMACGSVLFTDAGDEYGLKELFPDNSYMTYNKIDYSDVVEKGKKIINEPELRDYMTTEALQCIKEKHSHEVRGQELIDIITKKFGITFNSNTNNKLSLIGKICKFFSNTEEVKTTSETLPIIQEITPSVPVVNNIPNENEDTDKRNEKLIKKLLKKGIKVCFLKDTCYNSIVNYRYGEILSIAVSNESLARKIIGDYFNFEPFPKETKTYIFQDISIQIPYPIITYLTDLYGENIKELLNKKKFQLRLVDDKYNFIKRPKNRKK